MSHELIPEPQSTAPTERPVSSFADRIAQHPFQTSVLLLLLVVIGGSMLALSRRPVASTSGPETQWQGGGYALINEQAVRPTSSTRPRTETLIANNNPSAPLPVLPTVAYPQVFTPQETAENDITELLKSLTQPPQPSTDTGERPTQSSLLFIPQGLISTSTPQTERTAKQVALYDYANTVGTYLSGIDNAQSEMVQALTAVIQDKGNPGKVADAKRLADAYTLLADDLRSVSVPTEVRGLHDIFVSTHEDIAKNLTAVITSMNDEDMVTTIGTYNASADAYIRAYLALVTFFEAQDVRFDRLDPGSVFTFTSVNQ